MEDRTPFFFGLQVDEILGVKEASRVGSVIGASDLARALWNFREGTEREARLIRHADAFIGACAWS